MGSQRNMNRAAMAAVALAAAASCHAAVTFVSSSRSPVGGAVRGVLPQLDFLDSAEESFDRATSFDRAGVRPAEEPASFFSSSAAARSLGLGAFLGLVLVFSAGPQSAFAEDGAVAEGPDLTGSFPFLLGFAVVGLGLPALVVISDSKGKRQNVNSEEEEKKALAEEKAAEEAKAQAATLKIAVPVVGVLAVAAFAYTVVLPNLAP
ncbi:unnamed protein product [Polarella glacialis]|uniref:Uncharacterized protein n=1 Tax=Polarella glacialis TaxID=89957 RepID=A0A813K6I9_POLGL|nr:unnamed protein product [Polarella glacialis]CAE8692514.1 unnamed protein product [Polarella glacialis]